MGGGGAAGASQRASFRLTRCKQQKGPWHVSPHVGLGKLAEATGSGGPVSPGSTVEKREAGLVCTVSSVAGSCTHLGTKRDSLLSPPLPQTQSPCHSSSTSLASLYTAGESVSSLNPENFGSGLRGSLHPKHTNKWQNQMMWWHLGVKAQLESSGKNWCHDVPEKR